MWVRDLSLALSKNQDCKVGTFTITSTYTSRLFHHTLWSPCVKPDVHQFTSHLFAYEMKMKHVLKLQLKTVSFSNNFYRHYALVIMDSNFKNLRGNYLEQQQNCLRTQKWWISPASCQNKAIIMLFCFFWSFEQIEKGHDCNKRRSLCKSTFVIWADIDLLTQHFEKWLQLAK